MSESLAFQNFTTRLGGFIKQASASIGSCDSLSCSSSDGEFNVLALDLFGLQFEHVLVYRKYCEARRVTPKIISNWESIPALPIAAFKELEVSSLPANERIAVFHSSGTTAQKPSRHRHSADSLRLYEASLRPVFRHYLLGDLSERDRMTFVILTPSSMLVPHSSLVHMFEMVCREFGTPASVFTGKLDAAGAWAVDLDHTLALIRQATSDNHPVALLGTAFSFVHLLDHLAANSIRCRLPAGSRVMETGGYKGRSRTLPKEELHDLIAKLLGVPPTHIVSEYGMSELSSQAYDRRIGGLEDRLSSRSRDSVAGTPPFHFPPWARAQVISVETGEPVSEGEAGLLRIFDLANVRSVFALQTEDLGIHRENGFELIGRAALAEPRGCSLMTP